MFENLLLFKFTISFLLFSCLILSLGFFFNWFSTERDFEKNSVYECGFDSFLKNADLKNFDLEFLIIAIFYLIFDLEIAILLPWVIYFPICSFNGCIFVLIFLSFLFFGFFLEYLRGVLHSNIVFLKK